MITKFESILFKDSFASQKDLFHALKDNEETIISLKTSTVYKSIDKGQGVFNLPLIPKNEADKARYKAGYIYPVINSTQWLDSHGDVHLKGCYKRTVNNQQGKVYYIDSHLKGLSNIITKRQDIEMYIDNVEWSLLGKNIDGTTQALLFKIAEENVKTDYLSLIKEDKSLQNSFAMRYIKVRMAVNSNDKAFVENKDFYDNVIDTIANKEEAEKAGHFFGVEELAIVGEGSLCPVIGGSNSATSVIQIETKEDTSKDTLNNDPSKDTQTIKSYLDYSKKLIIN